MCRVVSCPACGSVDSRAHHHSLVYYALRCYGSFLSSSLTVSATKLLPLPSSHHPSITNYDYDYYFMLFSFSFPIAVAVIPYWTNLKKKVNSKEKKVLFFARQPPYTCESPNFTSYILLSLSSVYRLNSNLLPCLHSFNFFSGFDYRTIASCTTQIQIQP